MNCDQAKRPDRDRNELQAGADGHVWCYVGLEAAQQDDIESLFFALQRVVTSSSKLVNRSDGSPFTFRLFAVDERDVFKR